MKKLSFGLVALATTMIGLPGLTTTAGAHPRGEVCRYQSVDRNGDVSRRSDYCHHLPSKFQQRPRAGFSLYFGLGDGFYFGSQPRVIRNGPQEQVCLVTFFKRSQVSAGADANVQTAQLLPIREAKRRDGPNDRQRIFDYGTNRQTRETCNYLNGINR